MIVDAHAHIWKADPGYPAPSATIMSPLSDVPLGLLRGTLEEHGVDRAVLVQPMYPGEDNSMVADAAREDPVRFAAVAVVDPRAPGAPERLEHWARERGCRGLRLRPSFAGEGEVFGEPSTFPLWERARGLGLVVSVLARMQHAARIGALAERFPEVPVIVDHFAHPDVAAGPGGWAPLLELARRPNVHVKPTGYYYFSRQEYPYADCADLFRAVYDRFGPDRLVWGSDFPHVLLKSGYARSRRHLERHFWFVGRDERARIMGGNAARLYWKGEGR